MVESGGRSHWERVYSTKSPREVSWYQREPRVSLDLVRASGVAKDAPILDVGGGASTLVDALLAEGFSDVTVLDVAEPALAAARERLGAAAARVRWICADVTAWRPDRSYALWHDRAVFHFLVDPTSRTLYRETMTAALRPDGAAIVATFAEDGPERCSGLPVRRYSPDELEHELGGVLEPVEVTDERHVTPSGAMQHFVYVRFVRVS